MIIPLIILLFFILAWRAKKLGPALKWGVMMPIRLSGLLVTGAIKWLILKPLRGILRSRSAKAGAGPKSSESMPKKQLKPVLMMASRLR